MMLTVHPAVSIHMLSAFARCQHVHTVSMCMQP